MKLDHRAAAAAGVRLIVHDQVGSTSSEALALARGGERGPLWIFAREQAAGRGRRGRRWHSPPGNFHASLLLSEPCAPECAPQLSFVAALALHDALADLHSELARGLRFKWPNDLLLAGAKIAGVLVEGETTPDRRLIAVIGVGVNCVAHPDDAPYAAQNFRAAGFFSVTPEALMPALSRSMRARLTAWAGGASFDRVREDWMAHAAPIGETMRVREADMSIVGRFGGIDGVGRLILILPDGTQRIFHAAEVVPPLDTPEILRAGAAL